MAQNKIYWLAGLSVINPNNLRENECLIISSSLNPDSLRPCLNLEVKMLNSSSISEFGISYWDMYEDECLSTLEEVMDYRRKNNIDVWAEIKNLYEDLGVKGHLDLIGKKMLGLYYAPLNHSLVGLRKI